MKYPWLEQYCLGKLGAKKDFKIEWDVIRYLLFDKMFLMQGENKQGQEIITVKLVPEHGELLRVQYPQYITAGYYMNKIHWNSIDLNGDVPDDLVKEIIDESYKLILQSLPKTKQKEIEALNN